MQKKTIAVLLACSVTLFSAAQPGPGGDWVGINMENHLPIVFHIVADSPDTFSGAWDSPLQGALGMKCRTVIVSHDSMIIETAGISAFYRGRFRSGQDSIYGVWQQNGHDLPLDLKRMLRPQTPQPPFPYYADSVEYDNKDRTVHLGATLTRPKTKKRSPAVILITGSGLQDRDETLFGHHPFAVLADWLTKRGIAVLRVDDRTKGKSRGDIKNATSADYADDVITSYRYLASRDDIDTGRIGLIGHSEGGMIAPMVAAREKGIAFIVLWGAPAAGGKKINIEQNAFQLKKMNIGDTAVRAFKDLHGAILEQFDKVASKKELDSAMDPIFGRWRSSQDSNTLAQLHVKNNDLLGLNIHQFYAPLFNTPWLRFFITYDPFTDLSRVSCPILAINGSKDTQVYADDNLPMIAAAAKGSHNPDCTTLALPGLNHLLQTAGTGDLSEYLTLDETISPGALQVIGDWILKRVANR